MTTLDVPTFDPVNPRRPVDIVVVLSELIGQTVYPVVWKADADGEPVGKCLGLAVEPLTKGYKRVDVFGVTSWWTRNDKETP